MIDERIIEKAKAAYITRCGKTCSHDSLTAALEAVAADIWDEGESIGYVHGQHDAHRFEPGPDYRETPNPYRASETA